jgi:hypothetical protein
MVATIRKYAPCDRGEKSEPTPGRFRGRCVAVTSLNPSPLRWETQRKCLQSLIDAGLDVLAVNTAAELANLDLPSGITGIACDRVALHYDRQTQLVSSLIHLGAETGTPFLLINSDIECQGGSDLLEQALGYSDALTICVRHNYTTSMSYARPEPDGLDAFLMTPKMARTVPRDAPLAIGKPVWDYWIPHHFRARGHPFHWITSAVFFHQNHTIGWTQDDWTKGRDFMRATYGVELGYGSREFRRGLRLTQHADG